MLVDQRLVSGLSLVGVLLVFCCFFLGGAVSVSLEVLPAVCCEGTVQMKTYLKAVVSQLIINTSLNVLYIGGRIKGRVKPHKNIVQQNCFFFFTVEF